MRVGEVGGDVVVAVVVDSVGTGVAVNMDIVEEFIGWGGPVGGFALSRTKTSNV